MASITVKSRRLGEHAYLVAEPTPEQAAALVQRALQQIAIDVQASWPRRTSFATQDELNEELERFYARHCK